MAINRFNDGDVLYAAPLNQMVDEINNNAEESASIKADLTKLITSTVSKNIFDKSIVIPNKQIYSSGALGNDDTRNFTGYIPVNGLSQITVTLCDFGSPNAGNNYCFYDENYNGIDGGRKNGLPKNGTEYPTTINVPSGAYYFGFHWQKIHGTADTIMVQEGDTFTGYEPYGDTEIILPSNEVIEARGGYATLNDRLNTISTPKNTIICWGDSLTEGNQMNDGGTMPKSLQTLVGASYEVKNFGRGGDLANNVACRQGGMNYVIKAGQTIPSSGSVTLDIEDNFGKDVSVRISPSASVLSVESLNPVSINGIAGNLERASSAYPLNQAVFTRLNSGSIMNIDRPINVESNGEKFKGTLILWLGQNMGFDINNPYDLLNIIKNMINHSNTNNYLVIGLPHSKGTHNYTWQNGVNNALMNEYGRKFIDVEKYMKTPIYNGDTIVSSYAVADSGASLMDGDLALIASNDYPRCIMRSDIVDYIHFNKFGYSVVASLIYKRGKELGYWS